MNLPDKFIFGLTNTEYRPCYVIIHRRGGNAIRKKALFHKWTFEQTPISPGLSRGSHPGGQFSHTKAIVETEDGHVLLVEPEQIEFIDTQGMMDQLAWDEEEAET